LTAYVAFGTSIVAPCEGVVAARENSKPDMPVGQMDPDNPAGNFVALQCGEVVVVLAHLQQGSVPLQVGTVVRAGQQIGRIGNSGNTSEPHLHIHAVRGRFTSLDALLFEGSGVPLTFDGRFLLRGDSGH
jgi:murein DD-endopeptidase MepM/ murein hydrolase activator NlpD